MAVTYWVRRFALALLCVACVNAPWRIASASTYVALSLQQAEKQLRTNGDLSPRAKRLGGITDPMGLVYDERTKDLILIGKADADAAELTMDDFVVAVRSILVHRTWPLVSIDKDEHTYETKRQTVRFKGGIADSAFGRDALQGDVFLKDLAFGKIGAQVWGITSYFDKLCRLAERGETRQHVRTRFWFIGDENAAGFVDREGVMLVDRLPIAVEARVATATGNSGNQPVAQKDEIGVEFAGTLSDSFGDLAQEFPILRRIHTLFKLVALATGITKLDYKYESFQPDLSYWRDEYEVARVPTPTDYPLIEKERTVSSPGKPVRVRLDGGLEFKPLLLDFQDGSVTALRDVVLKCRPKPSAMVWRVPLEYWKSLEALDRPAASQEQELQAFVRDFGDSLGVTLDAYIGSAQNRLPTGGQAVATGFSDFRPRIPEFKYQDRVAAAAHIGGVMLAGTAEVEGAERAEVSSAEGNFSLVVDGKNARIDPKLFRKFVTALWCVYYSDQDPGISIDPIAPDVDKHLVRYIGRVINTDLARVMREADYRMKKWAVGTQRPDIKGFRDIDTWSYYQGNATLASRRFWFVPENLRFKRGGDLLLFDSGRMRVKTEFLAEGLRGRAAPSDEAFAGFFTEHYQEIAEKYPAYKELFEYAKLVALAKYLKAQGVPLYWFLMAHKDLVLTEDSPGTVAQLAKGSQYFQGLTIQGGVNLGAKSHYVLDAEAAAAINKALRLHPAGPAPAASTRRDRPVPCVQPVSFDANRKSYTVLPQHTASSGKDHHGNRYQTDLALRCDGSPGLELVRYFNPRQRDTGQFGRGWHLLIPYRLKPADKATRTFLNAVIPQRMVIENLMSGQQETLTFSVDRYAAVGYVPDKLESSQVIGLFLMSNGSFRLADKLGNQFHFDPSGRMTDMFLSPSPEHHMHLEYADKFTGAIAPAPYAARPADDEKVEVHGLSIPKRVKVTDLVHNQTEILCFAKELDVVGYVPEEVKTSRFRRLALLSNGGLELRDKHDNLIRFDSSWDFEAILPSPRQFLVRTMTMGTQRVRFSYTIDCDGRVVIATAAVSANPAQRGPTYVVRYEYDAQSRLVRVCRPHPALTVIRSTQTTPAKQLSYAVTVHGHGAKTDSGKGVHDVPGLRGAIG